MESITDTAVEFVSKLIDIWDDREFIISMLSIAEHDDDKRTIIENAYRLNSASHNILKKSVLLDE